MYIWKIQVRITVHGPAIRIGQFEEFTINFYKSRGKVKKYNN